MDPNQTILVSEAEQLLATSTTGELSDEAYGQALWTDQLIEQSGIPITDVPLVSIGGGLGSFALIDFLRIAGVPANDMAVLTTLERPSDTYELLADNSQIPRDARLRSDSGSVMDNIWGWPGYALREAWADRSLSAAWQVLTEPVLKEFYTPKAGQVFESVDRETARIGWSQMIHRGIVRTVRRRDGGGYFVIQTPPKGESTTRRRAFRCSFVHVSVGYPGIALLPDLQDYRQRTGDRVRVVNSYERHDHVYEELRRRPSTVLIRGSGIVASRVLQRLIDDRDNHGAQTRILHLFRNYVGGPQGEDPKFKRFGENGFAYQAFNYPKAAWGGQLRDQLEALEGAERAQLIDAMGGTNTAYRSDWQAQLKRGLAEGFYSQAAGKVTSVEPNADGTGLVTNITTSAGISQQLDTNFIIDATGLLADIRKHRLLSDLLDYVGAGTNPKGRLDVAPTFEIRGTQHGPGRLYASGSITLGGYYAGVDSFLGLQYAALQIADDLASVGFGKAIDPIRSASQWVRWARNQTP